LQLLGLAQDNFLSAVTDNQLSAEQAHALAQRHLTADSQDG